MKKIIAAILCVSMLSLVGCSSSDKSEKKVLKVFNWGEYIDETVIDTFEQETGIDVIYDTFETNESMYTKVTASGNQNSYDIVIPSDYMIAKMIKEDLLHKIDYNNIPNYKLMMEQFTSKPFNDFDPTNEHFVPYVWGTVGIVYDKTKVKEPVDSWNILFNEKYKNEVLMKQDQRDSIGIALKSLGYSVNSKNDKELDEAYQKLAKQRPMVLAYVNDEGRDKMIGGEAAMAVMYSGDASYVMEENKNLDYALPKEGTNVWLDGMCVLKSSQNKELAEQFINFMLRTDIAQKNIDYIQYNSPQKEVVENMPQDKKDSVLHNPPTDYINNKCEIYTDLGNYTEIYSKMWTDLFAN